MGLNNQHTTYQGSRVTITISITGWQLELGPAGKLCSGWLELYNVVGIMCGRCDLCLEHNVQCPLIRFQAKLMYCIFPLRRQLCTLEEEKWVVILKLKFCAVYIVWSWEVESRVSVIVVVREDLNWKKTFSFGHCPNYLNPPPHHPNSGNLVLFFRTSKFKIWKSV